MAPRCAPSRWSSEARSQPFREAFTERRTRRRGSACERGWGGCHHARLEALASPRQLPAEQTGCRVLAVLLALAAPAVRARVHAHAACGGAVRAVALPQVLMALAAAEARLDVVRRVEGRAGERLRRAELDADRAALASFEPAWDPVAPGDAPALVSGAPVSTVTQRTRGPCSRVMSSEFLPIQP
jgi:hypothetical protein